MKNHEPWLNEPDAEQGEDKGYRWEICRQRYGYLCGYVELPHGHVFHGRDADEFPLRSLSVHGGITYAGPPHRRLPLDPPDSWWIGFDCGHMSDHRPYEPPYIQQWFNYDKRAYRNWTYVKEEVISLIGQIARYAEVPYGLKLPRGIEDATLIYWIARNFPDHIVEHNFDQIICWLPSCDARQFLQFVWGGEAV